VKHVQALLEQIGLEPERIRMVNISAAMAGEFVAVAEEMTEVITNLGPNPLKVR
jgi:coenzyme F420-reducing hydrogenase delta subunit